jgi:hypothetical protein
MIIHPEDALALENARRADLQREVRQARVDAAILLSRTRRLISWLLRFGVVSTTTPSRQGNAAPAGSTATVAITTQPS